MKIAPQIDGLFSITDRTAIGVINHFKNIALKVPEDIAVIGFSNWKTSALTSHKLSSVEQNGFLMGNRVIEVFIKILKNNDTINEAFTTTLFQQHLSQRIL
tara:strand:- start:232 stop:534 length:303 start_codon:yes stop_codon:yes gene_type:complete